MTSRHTINSLINSITDYLCLTVANMLMKKLSDLQKEKETLKKKVAVEEENL
jgi:hypothetical protein